MLYASDLYRESQNHFETMGLVGGLTVDLPKMQTYKQSVVDNNTKGIEFLFKKNKIDWLKGWGKITAPGEVSVDGTPRKAKTIVIATGSEVTPLRGVTINEKTIVSSTGALALAEVPKRLVVVGAGVIGLELGSVYSRLGAEVSVLEFLDQITPGMDLEACKTLQRLLTKQGLSFVLGAAVQSAEPAEGGTRVTYKLRKDDSEHTLDADIVLVATGRRPYVEGVGVTELGIALTSRGQIEVDARWQTSVPGIYALGDAIAGPMLAHKAEDEGMAVAETIAGQHGHVNYGVIPSVIYTAPEVASVGQTEEQLKEAGRAYKVGKFPFLGNARAKSHFAGDGFVEDPRGQGDRSHPRRAHRRALCRGSHPRICVGMEFGAAAEDIARTCHAHPTFSEAVREAALACGDGAIHA